MHWDFTINIGTVIAAICFGSAAIVSWNNMNWRMKNQEEWKETITNLLKDSALLSKEYSKAQGDAMSVMLNNLSEMKTVTALLQAIATSQDHRLSTLETVKSARR